MEYTLIRSDRRTLCIEITRDGGITVRAPKRASVRDIERFLSSKSTWIAEHIEKQRQRAENHPEPTDEERAALIRRAKTVLPERVTHYSRIMGLYPTRMTVTSAKTRFGSCSAKNSLSFSWRLMQYPDEAVDYVVVHELAHIVHKNHGAGFYALVEKYLPDWRARRAMLRD